MKRSKHILLKNIYYLLSYAYKDLRLETFLDVQTEEFDHLEDLFAAILAKGISLQIKRGLYREYEEHAENLQTLRGRIDMREAFLRRGTRSLPCRYDILSENTLHNQILRAGMLALLRAPELKREHHIALKRLLPYFSEVSALEPERIPWDRVEFHRGNQGYRMLTQICRLFFKGQLLSTEAGSEHLAQFCDSQEFHRLYERFLLEYFRTHHQALRPRARQISWNVEESMEGSLLPKMRSDLVLCRGDRRLIVDAKCYGRTMQQHHGNKSYISAHLYQIFAYVKNTDVSSTGKVAGMLLYARTDEALQPCHSYRIGGNLFYLRTLDLLQDFSQVRRQLDALTLCL